MTRIHVQPLQREGEREGEEKMKMEKRRVDSERVRERSERGRAVERDAT